MKRRVRGATTKLVHRRKKRYQKPGLRRFGRLEELVQFNAGAANDTLPNSYATF